MIRTPQTTASMFSRLAGQSASGAGRLRRRGCMSKAAGEAGVGGETMVETLEARQVMAADLAIELGNYAPLSFYVPGETVTIPYVVRNNEPMAFTGRAVVTLSLSGTGGAQASSALSLSNLATDATASGALSFTIPSEFFPRSYTPTLTLTMRNAANTADVEDNSTLDNQITLANNALAVRWGFGTFDGRTNVVMRAADGDGTQFTMSMTGGGYGQFVYFAEVGFPNKLVLHGVRGASGPIAQSVNFAVVAGSPGTIAGADFNSLLGVADQLSDGPELLIGNFNAPEVNFKRGLGLSFAKFSVTNASSTITVGDIGSAAHPNDYTYVDGDVGSFTAGAVRIGLGFGRTTGAIRLGSLGQASGGQVALYIGRNAASLTIGSPTNLTTTAMQNAQINVFGDVGAVTIGKVDGTTADPTGSNVTITVRGRTGAMTFGDLVRARVTTTNAPASFTARDIRSSTMNMGRPGTLGTVASPFTAREISESLIQLSYPVSTFTASKWQSATPSRNLPENSNYLLVESIATMNIGAAGATTDPTNGNFDATAYIGGQRSLAMQLGTVNIRGTLSGSIFVAGSVGAFTAKVVDSDLFRSTPVGLGRTTGFTLDWAPALTATGSVLSFTSGDVRSGALWVNSVRTLNVTVASSNRNFEVVAGFRADRNAIIDGAGRNFVLQGGGDYAAPQIRSGIIGALNLTLRTPTGGAVTGFTGRFAAGLDVLSPVQIVRRFVVGGIGALNFALFTGDNQVGTPASDGRINAINVIGVLASNSLGFAARDFPVARFNFGTLQTGAAGVLTPARTHPYSSDIQGTSIPASTFFRVGLPD